MYVPANEAWLLIIMFTFYKHELDPKLANFFYREPPYHCYIYAQREVHAFPVKL